MESQLETDNRIHDLLTVSNKPEREILACEQELRDLGFSEAEIQKLGNQIDSVIERSFDKYLSKIYENENATTEN